MYTLRFSGACLFTRYAGVFCMLCLVCLAADLDAAPRSHRNTSCLKKDFFLYNVIDLELKDLARARTHLEREEYGECEREILSYFASRAAPCRLEPWGTRPDAVREAEAILDNSYKFWLYDRFELPVDLTWRENPARSRNWIYNLMSFEFLGILNEAHTVSGDPRFLERGGELIIDFKNDNYNPERLPSKDLSWYEHTVANRLLCLLDFWRILLDTEKPDSTFTKAYLDLVWRHARFLAIDENYSRDSNHGIFNAAALLRMSLLFPEFREASEWGVLAVRRLETQLADNVTSDGVHGEYSPWYQIWVAGILEQIGRDCHANGISISSETMSAIERMLDAIPHFFFPDGSISLFGDSDAYPSMPLQHRALSRLPAYRYIRSAGKGGGRPAGCTHEFPVAGFFIMRSGWGKRRLLRDETCLMANMSGEARQHDHYDSMSFEFYAREQKWITDLGRWAYEHNDARRRYIISPIAHNIVVPYSTVDRPVSMDPEQVVPLRAKRDGADQQPSGRNASRRLRDDILPRISDKELLNLIAGVSLNAPAAVQAVIDTISAIKDVDTRIAACKRLLARNPRDFIDRLELHLAFCLGEEKSDLASAIRYLEDIVEHGTDQEAQSVARDLLAMYRPDEGEPEPPAKEMAITQDQSKSLVEEKPLKSEKPSVYHWISRREYDYLEGGTQYRKDFHWSRAFLFIKPYHLLIIDVIHAGKQIKAKQLFHMPPSVSVTREGDRYLLTSDDSLRCVVKPLFTEPLVDYSIIEGQKSPQYQGWYSDTFFTLQEAPVIENLFDIRGDMTYIATVIVPVGDHDPERYVVRNLGDVDWNSTGPEPLNLEILEPGYRTTITLLPSSQLCGEQNIDRDPLIEITRRMR